MKTFESEKVIKGIKEFQQRLNTDNSAELSWEHCYRVFGKARNNKPNDVDCLCLHLAFYLASWGMYRGSSFLTKRDYKVHEPVVKEILKDEYNPLF